MPFWCACLWFVSRTFQRFAVRTEKQLQELSEKGLSFLKVGTCLLSYSFWCEWCFWKTICFLQLLWRDEKWLRWWRIFQKALRWYRNDSLLSFIYGQKCWLLLYLCCSLLLGNDARYLTGWLYNDDDLLPVVNLLGAVCQVIVIQCYQAGRKWYFLNNHERNGWFYRSGLSSSEYSNVVDNAC